MGKNEKEANNDDKNKPWVYKLQGKYMVTVNLRGEDISTQ